MLIERFNISYNNKSDNIEFNIFTFYIIEFINIRYFSN